MQSIALYMMPYFLGSFDGQAGCTGVAGMALGQFQSEKEAREANPSESLGPQGPGLPSLFLWRSTCALFSLGTETLGEGGSSE